MAIAHRWRKSTRSAQTENCVELPGTLDAVRDSKNGAVLRLSRQAVLGLISTVANELETTR